MSEWVKRAGVWVEDAGGVSPVVKRAGAWATPQEGWAKRLGVWERFHQNTDPITVQYFGNKWSPTFRASGAPSGGSNRDTLSYWGDGWNNENENSMVGFRDVDVAALEADLTLRPHIISGRVQNWVGHVFSGTRQAWVGFHGEKTTLPTAFSRLHSEKDAAWAISCQLPKPPSGAGASTWTALPASTLENLAAQFAAGNVGGMTITADDANFDEWWGWCSGDGVSTSNSGGNSGGIVDITDTTDSRSMILELTIDFVSPVSSI